MVFVEKNTWHAWLNMGIASLNMFLKTFDGARPRSMFMVHAVVRNMLTLHGCMIKETSHTCKASQLCLLGKGCWFGIRNPKPWSRARAIYLSMQLSAARTPKHIYILYIFIYIYIYDYLSKSQQNKHGSWHGHVKPVLVDPSPASLIQLLIWGVHFSFWNVAWFLLGFSNKKIVSLEPILGRPFGASYGR